MTTRCFQPAGNRRGVPGDGGQGPRGIRRRQRAGWAAGMLLLSAATASGNTLYVSPSGSHQAPYASWETAATNIQAAISAQTVPGGVVLVTNGWYATGQVTVAGLAPSRIAITNAIVVRSVNGPEWTHIVGGPGTRCAYVGNYARLAGFTLTNGQTPSSDFNSYPGAGAWCEVSALVSNCVITGNVSATLGGGTYRGTIVDCLIADNQAASAGGGSSRGTMRNCTIIGNSATDGGGTYETINQNCTIVGNRATNAGGMAYGYALNCIVMYNEAILRGANYLQYDYATNAIRNSCSTPLPGGTGNIAVPPGIAGIRNARLFASSPCRDAGANQTWMAGARDRDGEPRIDRRVVDMGSDEVHPSGLRGPLTATVSAQYTQAVEGVVLSFAAEIEGRPEGCRWIWGDGDITTDTISAAHAFVSPGTYPVTLETWNLDGKTTATLTVQVSAVQTNYVSPTGSDQAPYASWATAATNIQAAISVQIPGGVVLVTNGVYATGGAAVQGSLVNRIAITNGVTVRSVNGPDHTIILGEGPGGPSAVRCAYLGDGARLVGMTLSNGYTRTLVTGGIPSLEVEMRGGGAWCSPSAVISNCTIRGNWAYYFGGGVCGGLIENCLIEGNHAGHYLGGGGGVYDAVVRNSLIVANSGGYDAGGGMGQGTAENCTIVENVAVRGGGTTGTRLVNSIVLYNRLDNPDDIFAEGPNILRGEAEYTCASPLPPGPGNIETSLGLADVFDGDYRLQPQSPCRDAGINLAGMTEAVDLAGSPRIQNRVVDMGCYEYRTGLGLLHVSPSGLAVPPYATWATAATTIQDAIDLALDGDTVLVTNGVYDTGGVVIHGTMPNRIALTKAIVVRSVNGPEHTHIVGSGPTTNAPVRCAYVGEGARLEGFALSQGQTRLSGGLDTQQAGGGAWCEGSGVVAGCTITGNRAGSYGGGVYGGRVLNCRVVGNTAGLLGGGTYGGLVKSSLLRGNAAAAGGGAYAGLIKNCTVVENIAGEAGGGVSQAELLNCIVHNNQAPLGANTDGRSAEYTCTTPNPGGEGNVVVDPGFVDAGASDYHLLSTSPCIDAGSNQYWMGAAVELDGAPRIRNSIVDMGCYEFETGLADSDGDGIDDAWELGYFPSLTNLAWLADWDQDGFNDDSEFHAGTDPTDPSSYLGIRSVTLNPSANEVVVRWSSESNRLYAVHGSSSLVGGLDVPLDLHVPGTPPENAYTDNVDDVGIRLYGIEVEMQP